MSRTYKTSSCPRWWRIKAHERRWCQRERR